VSETVEVTGCVDCPAYDDGFNTCALADREQIALDDDCPDWCPLRTAPVLLRLKEDA